MYKELKGKKLLILGAYKTEIDIVNAARSMGIYTIVTDSHTDWNFAPAKYQADEAWDVSWSDIETLKKRCVEEKIDGCFAGFSERRIGFAQRLSNKIGKSFYSDNAKLDVICDKLKFKQTCIDSGVTVPAKYNYGEKVEYPVIVKPADNGGSRGITICYNDEELKIAYLKAMEASDSKEIVIEQYITADEVMVYFTVHNGNITVSAMCDRKMHRFDENITQLPIGYYFPSKYLDVFMQFNIDKYKKLIHSLGIRDGLIAFQAFVVGNDVIPFDPTYRLDGTMAYHMIEKRNDINVLKMLISKSLVGTMGEDEMIRQRENPYFTEPTCELPILLKAGTIAEIVGMNEIAAMEDVVFIHQGHNVGDVMEKKADFSQILCRIHICAKDNRILKKDIENIYSLLKAHDENGENMIISQYQLELEVD